MIPVTFQEAMQSLPWPVLIKGPHSEILWANLAFLSMYECELDDLLGKANSDSADHTRTAQYILDDRKAFEGMVITVSEEVVSNTGFRFPVETAKAPLRDCEGVPVGTIGISRPLFTGDDRISIAAAKDKAALERAIGEVRKTAWQVAHDWKKPAGQVVRWSNILLEEHAPHVTDESRIAFDEMKKATQILTDMTSALSEFSEAGRPTLSLFPILPLWRHVTKEMRIDVSAEGPDVMLLGDRSQIYRLLWNLAENAEKFRATKVCLRTCADGVFDVIDDGIGIPDKSRLEVFEMFRRGHTREEYPGTGMGLSTCKRVVESHGGIIKVMPASKGTRIRFTLDGVRPIA